MNKIIEYVENILTNNFQPKYLQILDLSNEHRSHNPPKGDGNYLQNVTHLKITIKSDIINQKNITLVKKHMLIKKSLQELFDKGLHSLSINVL